MKTSEVLRRVRTHLYYGRDYSVAHKHFICEALNYLYYAAGVIGDRDRTRVKKIITAMLLPHKTLEEWLEVNHNIACTHKLDYRQKIMVTRKAWLDHLIDFYSTKGD